MLCFLFVLSVLVYGKCKRLSCRCMSVACVHPVAVLNAAFCMICSLLMLVEDARGDNMEEAYSRDGLMTGHECLLLFTPSCCGE